MPRRRACANSKHAWKALRGGRHERCEICNAVFPCRGQCEHLDCKYVRGEEIPAYWQNLFAVMGVAMDTTGLVPWKDRNGGSKSAGE